MRLFIPVVAACALALGACGIPETLTIKDGAVVAAPAAPASAPAASEAQPQNVAPADPAALPPSRPVQAAPPAVQPRSAAPAPARCTGGGKPATLCPAP